MDKNLIRQVLADNAKLIDKLDVMPRNYNVEFDTNYIFTGVRRAGKSYMQFAMIRKLLSECYNIGDILYMNFEDERIEGFSMTDFNLLLECHKELYDRTPHIFLDEMQNIDGWEKFARRMADSKYHICLTGSNAKMLSKEIMTTLGGRFIQKDIYPFSFREYLDALNIPYGKNNLLDTDSRAFFFRHYDEYLMNGGMPETINKKVKREYLSSTYQKIYLNDIAARNGINNMNALRLLVKKIAESVGQPLSYNRLSHILSSFNGKISVPTVQNYVSYTEDAWLLLRLRNITGSLSEKESACKYYFVDNGFLNLFLLNGEPSLLENQVALELFRRFGHDTEHDTVYFYNSGIDVDFYVPEKEWAIQVSYSISDVDTRKREATALEKITKVLPCSRRTIITYDTEETITDKVGEIEVIPCWKWMIED